MLETYAATGAISAAFSGQDSLWSGRERLEMRCVSHLSSTDNLAKPSSTPVMAKHEVGRRRIEWRFILQCFLAAISSWLAPASAVERAPEQ
jgi:hypothetical protein